MKLFFCTWLWHHSMVAAGNITTQPKQGRQAMPMCRLCILLCLFHLLLISLYFLIHSFNNILSLLLCFLYAIFPFSYVSFYYILFLFLSPFSFFHPFSLFHCNLFLLIFSYIFSLLLLFLSSISISAIFQFYFWYS